MEDPAATVAFDPESELIASKKQMGNEWEIYKENVRPLKRGRNVTLLNEALKSQQDAQIKKTLIETRRKLIEAIEEYEGDDPLQAWLDCIKWVQESFPTGGECSGLVVIYEQCVRIFWHDDRYKEDLRYLKVWLEYAGNCADSEVIYRFLEANQIGQTKSAFYMAYALHMESKNKLKKADEIFNLGIARKAEPFGKLESAYRNFFMRSTRKTDAIEVDESTDDHLPARSFGTVLAAGETRRQLAGTYEIARKKTHIRSVNGNSTFSVYDDNGTGEGHHHHQPKVPKRDIRSWHTLGAQTDRNKENNSIPSKWTCHKIPQKTGLRTALATSSAPRIDVYVDEECSELPNDQAVKSSKASVLKLKRASNQNMKKDTELLKKNPLRNFPSNSLPR